VVTAKDINTFKWSTHTLAKATDKLWFSCTAARNWKL